jgi:hypothetical protein
LSEQELIQELAPGETYKGKFKGMVTIGLGCCCDENPPSDCNCQVVPPSDDDRRLQRGLLSDVMVNMVFEGEDFSFTTERTEATTTAPKCSSNFFLSLLQSLLGWLLRLLGKGPFCV